MEDLVGGREDCLCCSIVKNGQLEKIEFFVLNLDMNDVK